MSGVYSVDVKANATKTSYFFPERHDYAAIIGINDNYTTETNRTRTRSGVSAITIFICAIARPNKIDVTGSLDFSLLS